MKTNIPNTENGPLLPLVLVLVRVVTRLADIFLTYCNLNDIHVKTMTIGEQYKNKGQKIFPCNLLEMASMSY